MILKFSRGVWVLIGMVTACIIIIAATALYCTMASSAGAGEPGLDPPDVDYPPPPSHSLMGVYTSGAVVANSAPCATIGNKILKKYGSAVDAAIATMICDGVGCLQNMGLGGGFLMTIYIKDSGNVTHLDARETAPGAAHKDMYNAAPQAAMKGGMSVAVPGELRGYEAAYKMFGGKAPWKELFMDTVSLCEKGLTVDNHLANSLKGNEKNILESPTLRQFLLNKDGKIPVLGDNLKLPLLGQTLRQIAESGGAEILYNGSLTKGLIDDIRDAGGIITAEDMANYKVKWEHPIKVGLSGGLTAYSSPPPGSGAVLGLILKALDGLVPSGKGELTDIQRITEAFKFAYARRTQLGDPAFTNVSGVLNDLENNAYINLIRSNIWDNTTHNDSSWYGASFIGTEDHGTANIVVLAPNGDAVVATSTINLVFGSKLISKSTGIILNDEMDDFSLPSANNYFGLRPSEANLIQPGKRPLSSMCPTIITDSKGQVRLAVGAAGGTKITTASALVAIYNLWYNKTIKEAVDAPRFHHQLYPMKWQYEYGITKEIIRGMEAKGHESYRFGKTWRGALTAIAVGEDNLVTANADFRRSGKADGF